VPAVDPLTRHALARPDAPALIEGERRLGWREYHEARNRLAHALGDLGLDAGEHVVLYAPNSVEVVLASAAARARGLIPVPMNHRLTADEVAYILDDSDAVAVFVGDAYWGERVHAAVQPRAGATLAAAEVIDFCRRHLADYKTPREVSFHADFPRDSAGKLVKRLLREPHWKGRPTRV
jgi:acyl-CoA synthetase (AMP-forming)/AMP-acid ligase II